MRGSRSAASSRSSGSSSRSCSTAAPLLALCAACGSKSHEPRTPPLASVLAAMLDGADRASTPWRCAAVDTPALLPEELKAGDHAWNVASATLTRSDEGGSEIGVIADAAGSDPRTIAALGRLRAAFDDAKVDLVISLGGMGTTAAELEATLGTFADRAPWPLVALAGDLESESAQVAALKTLRTRGDIVLDARQVRTIKLPGATIFTVPGAGAAERLASPTEGCAWTAADVAATYAASTAQPGVRIVATAEAPRTTVDGEASGELALAPSKAQPVELVLHGPVEPAPTAARSGGRDGAGILLSPGTADATPRLPAAHRPSAGVLTLRQGAWAWRPIVED